MGGLVIPAVQLEHAGVGARGAVVGDAPPRRLARLRQLLLVASGDQEAPAAHLHPRGVASGPPGALPRGRDQHLARVAEGAEGVHDDAVPEFAGQPRVVRVHRRDQDLDVGMLDRRRGRLGILQQEAVVLALELGLRAILPAVPDRPHAEDVVAQPRARGRPWQRVPPLDVPLDLRAESEREAAPGESLQRPRQLRHHVGRTREGDRDAGAEPRSPCVLRRQRQARERLMRGLVGRQAVVAALLGESRLLGDRVQIMPDRRRHP